MKVLIVTTVSANRTATFIKEQIRFFPHTEVLYSEYRPCMHHDKLIFRLPLNINFVRICVKRILPRIYQQIYTKTLIHFLQDHRIDVVLCNYGTYGANITDACFQANIPLVVHFHGYDAFLHKTIKKYAEAYRNMFRKAAFIIAVSEDMRKQLIKLGAPENKIILRPYGVDTTVFTNTQPEANGRILLFVGRFTAKKDPVSLLKAFHLAKQTVPDAKLVMIGRGELYNLLLKTIDALQLQDSVEVMGWQTPEVVAQQMRQARAYVQHSVFAPNGDSEGSPVAIIEAAGSGLPVISTRHAGIKESVIDGVTGYLVDEDDWKAMGEYMADLLNNAELANKMGQAGREHILKNYDIKQQMAELKTVLERAYEQVDFIEKAK